MFKESNSAQTFIVFLLNWVERMVKLFLVKGQYKVVTLLGNWENSI